MQSWWQIIPDTWSGNWKTAWSIILCYHFRSSDLHVLLNKDNDSWCWQQPDREHTFLSDKMELPRVDTCRQWYTACTLFADESAATVSRDEVLISASAWWVKHLRSGLTAELVGHQHWSDERHCCSNLVVSQWAPEQEYWLILLSVTFWPYEAASCDEATPNYWRDVTRNSQTSDLSEWQLEVIHFLGQ